MLYGLNLGLKNVFLYTSFLHASKKQISFIDKLVEYGFVVHSKEVKEIRDRVSRSIVRKGNLDIELALDAYQFMNIYDTLILFSGDSDFAYLLDLLKEKGKRIIVVSTRKHMSYELMVRSYKYIDLKTLRSSIERKAPIKSLETTLADGLGGTTMDSIAK
jgi:uncharacterized LabA/DUF88 family protein